MLYAVDVGNSHTKFGRWDGTQWALVRVPTARSDDFSSAVAALRPEGSGEAPVWGCSVVPDARGAVERALPFPVRWLETGAQVGLRVVYEPVSAVGPDRLANALGGMALAGAPVIVVDLGTATTFDVVNFDGDFVGGAILPGPETAARSLARGTALLPNAALERPGRSIGQSTLESLRSGLVLAYADGLEGLVGRMREELGNPDAPVIATGGWGSLFSSLCASLGRYEPLLTLEGLRQAASRAQP
ncbi:MAG: type III pantothenate kinase [Fimbriimonadaceae bacterium]|nr:type III pantothenate kinase [Fimbriimonadaceae bacterium]